MGYSIDIRRVDDSSDFFNCAKAIESWVEVLQDLEMSATYIEIEELEGLKADLGEARKCYDALDISTNAIDNVLQGPLQQMIDNPLNNLDWVEDLIQKLRVIQDELNAMGFEWQHEELEQSKRLRETERDISYWKTRI